MNKVPDGTNDEGKPAPPPTGRRDDSFDAHGWQDLLRMRRVREQDENAQASSLQAQRCQARFQAHAWKTSATMIATAGAAIVGAVFAWGSAEHHEIRATSSLVTHGHSEIALSRELETLRQTLLVQLETIDRKIDRLSQAPRFSRAPPGPAGPP